MNRDTVGKIATDLLQEAPATQSPIDIEREVHKTWDKDLFECIERGKKIYTDDFYVVVITKKERLLENVLRHYFVPRSTCPTPDYDQTVYKFHQKNSAIEFIWVVPSQDACHYLRNNAKEVVAEERDLLIYVLQFADGTLYKRAKQLNNEVEALGVTLKEK